MINSYLNSFKISKKPIKQQGLCTKAKLGKKSKIISSVLIKNEYFLEFTRQCYKHLKPTCTWLQGCQNVLSSRQIIMNSRRLWNSHQGTSSWGPWHLATFWNLESRKWHFQGFSRGILHHRGCHVVSSEYAQDWEQCSRNRLSKCPRLIVWTFHRSKPA